MYFDFTLLWILCFVLRLLEALSLGSVEEKAMAPHSRTFAWKIPWTEESGRLQSMGSLESDTTERLPFHFSLSGIGEGNGNPLQCSCLENARDGGAWRAAIHGAAQRRTRLKRLSSSRGDFDNIFLMSLEFIEILSDVRNNSHR